MPWKLTSSKPIGLFDSGLGGLSIWKDIVTLLPGESTIYLADSQNAPYGERSPAEIVRLSVKNTELLLSLGAKIIVVACNTATTNAIAHLRKQYKVPFIGIEPATKPAAIATNTKKIGILATKGTLASELFLNTSATFRGDVEIIETIGTGLVQLIEGGNLEDARPLLQKYLSPMLEKGVDNIVLGCTHYPFLTEIIREIVPTHVAIIDSGAAVARQTKNVLEQHHLLGATEIPQHHFYTNAKPEPMDYFLKKLGVRNGIATYRNF